MSDNWRSSNNFGWPSFDDETKAKKTAGVDPYKQVEGQCSKSMGWGDQQLEEPGNFTW